MLTNLEQATLLLDMGMVDSLIDEIRTHNPTVANALATLARDFRYEEITILIQEAKEK